MRHFISALCIVCFHWVGVAQGSTCVPNLVRPEDFSDPAAHYKEWALQKICFDDFDQPTKMSTEDDRLGVTFYQVTSIGESGLPSGYRVTRIVGRLSDTREITVSITKTQERTPLSVTAKTTEGYELAAGF